MSNTLDVDKIVSEVFKRLYLRFGIKALLVIDQPPQEEIIKQVSQRFNLPWLSIDICYMCDMTPYEMAKVENSGLLINNCFKWSQDMTQCVNESRFLILTDLSIEESKRYSELEMKSAKDRLVYDFLKEGKDVYYYSEDLMSTTEAKPKFTELLFKRVEVLSRLGLKMINASYPVLEGVLDLKRLKAFEGQTVIVKENAVVSPLAQDYIKSGAVKVIRK